MAVAVMERDRISEIAETDEIKELRKQYRQENEMSYAKNKDILSLADLLSAICGFNVYLGEEAARYFEILDTKDFLLEKYAALPDVEAAKYKDELELYLREANKELEFLKNEIINE